MIKEDYVSFETAKLLKERGFNAETDHELWYVIKNFSTGCHWNCCTYKVGDITREYDKKYCIVMPTLQMAMKWLRSKKIFIDIYHYNSNMAPFIWHIFAYNINKPETAKTYEEAAENAINFVLQNWDDVNKVLADYYKNDLVFGKI